MPIFFKGSGRSTFFLPICGCNLCCSLQPTILLVGTRRTNLLPHEIVGSPKNINCRIAFYSLLTILLFILSYSINSCSICCLLLAVPCFCIVKVGTNALGGPLVPKIAILIDMIDWLISIFTCIPRHKISVYVNIIQYIS